MSHVRGPYGNRTRTTRRDKPALLPFNQRTNNNHKTFLLQDKNDYLLTSVIKTSTANSMHGMQVVGPPRFELGRPPCKGGIFNHYMIALYVGNTGLEPITSASETDVFTITRNSQ